MVGGLVPRNFLPHSSPSSYKHYQAKMSTAAELKKMMEDMAVRLVEMERKEAEEREERRRAEEEEARRKAEEEKRLAEEAEKLRKEEEERREAEEWRVAEEKRVAEGKIAAAKAELERLAAGGKLMRMPAARSDHEEGSSTIKSSPRRVANGCWACRSKRMECVRSG